MLQNWHPRAEAGHVQGRIGTRRRRRLNSKNGWADGLSNRTTGKATMKKLISVAALAAVVSLTTPAFADSTGVTMINRCNAQSEAGHSVSIETSSAAICKSSAHYFESLIPYNPGDWAVIYAWGFCLGMEGISEGIIGKTGNCQGV